MKNSSFIDQYQSLLRRASEELKIIVDEYQYKNSWDQYADSAIEVAREIDNFMSEHDGKKFNVLVNAMFESDSVNDDEDDEP
jgi:ribonuclease HIII